jgi:hypothetical protein
VSPARWLLPGVLILLAWWPRAEAAPSPGECSGPGGTGPSHCLYRSLMPSTGMVADCRNDRDCRVGYYYGGPEQVTWLTPPAGMATMPKPDVIWHNATFAEARVSCGRGCTWSYFFEAKRRQLSPPRRDVLQADYRRLLMAQVDGRGLAVRQIFTAREALRIEREWAPGLGVAEAITEIRFDPDGRLSLTWLKGPDRAPVRERVTVPSFAR